MAESPSSVEALTLAQALARLSVVALIQLVGFFATIVLVKWGPRWFTGTSKADWQSDCLRGAYVFGGTSLLALFVTLIFGLLFSLDASVPERVISGVFAVNTIFFAFAMARTGGAACSFFSQLVPIQLSGILVLEQQKAMMTHTRLTTWTFAIFSTFIWVAAVLFRKRLARRLHWKEFILEPGLEKFTVFAATCLFTLSIGVTVLAYWLPPRPEFILFIQRHRPI
jgi:hypothetical protein